MCKMNEILRVNDLHMYIVKGKLFYTHGVQQCLQQGRLYFQNMMYFHKNKTIIHVHHHR